LWFVATALGLWRYNKFVWFNWWMRYLLPGFAFFVAWAAVSLFDLFGTDDIGEASRVGPNVYRWCRRVIAVGLVGLFLYLTPWSQLYKYGFERFGTVSGNPSAAPNQKWSQIHGYGPSYRGWNRAVELAEQTDGRILSADTRIWQMLDGGIVYDTWSVPETHSTVDEGGEWLRRHQVTVLVDMHRGNASFRSKDRQRGTALHDFVRSANVEERGKSGQHRFYVVGAGE